MLLFGSCLSYHAYVQMSSVYQGNHKYFKAPFSRKYTSSHAMFIITEFIYIIASFINVKEKLSLIKRGWRYQAISVIIVTVMLCIIFKLIVKAKQ